MRVMQNDTPNIEGVKLTEIAERLAVPYTTVHYWYKKKDVPHWRRPALAEAIAAIKRAKQAESKDARKTAAAQSPEKVITKAVGA